jgi:hypothetical protein
MQNRKQKEIELKNLLESSILLEEENQKFWLDHLGVLPDEIFENVYKAVESKDKAMRTLIAEALKNDPHHQYLKELQGKIQAIKEKAFQYDESVEKNKADTDLSKLLNNL